MSASCALFCGTSGYSYKGWKGSFYPEDLPASQFLSFYASKLGTVEINNTFYRMPKTSVLEQWRQAVPESFRFVLKASRRLTHQQRLKDCSETLSYLVDTSSVLGETRGPFLFQLPPFMKKNADRLRAFLELLPETTRAAFEFRDPSWFDDEIFRALEERQMALCLADNGKDTDPPVVTTASWGYARLRQSSYTPTDVDDWAARLKGLGLRELFVFFKHEDEGVGPKLAARFEEAWQLAA